MVRIYSLRDLGYVVNGDMTQTVNYPWVDCSDFAWVRFNMWWAAVAATNVVFTVQGTCDYGRDSSGQPLIAAGSIVTLTPDAIEGNSGNLTAGAGASAAMIKILCPPSLVRIALTTHTAGGSATQLNIRVQGHGA